ncbi:hypothetical protein AMPC_30240 [Anaeromyxobacter paludicola]|uniref:Alkyl hydroperoxide reductase subunit C/ Thiol specific antioxidant domain-containing protein n=2 Tax=Anaeromyxobacter paludicola TaxID=2918171 RepID=A0ABM7XDF7_9BACT|nr:hypothetical protein AMPC_30240 [Anaeromyxobacter paludicola]
MARLAVLALASLLCALPASAAAGRFSLRVSVGDPLADARLMGLDGRPVRLLADRAPTVFLFLRPGDEGSREALQGLLALRAALAGKPVRLVAVVSPADGPERVRALLRDSPGLTVLVDRGDALHARLGTFPLPAVGLAGPDHRLAAFEPWTDRDETAALARAIEELLDGPTVAAAWR